LSRKLAMAFPVTSLGSLRGASAPLFSSSPLKKKMILKGNLKGLSLFKEENDAKGKFEGAKPLQ